MMIIIIIIIIIIIANAQMTHIQVQNWKNVLVVCLQYTPVTCLVFSVYVTTTQRLNHSGQESKQKFAVHNSDTPVTLKQGQCHQSWYGLTDSKQGYTHAQFEKPHIESVREIFNDKMFFVCLFFVVVFCFLFLFVCFFVVVVVVFGQIRKHTFVS